MSRLLSQAESGLAPRAAPWRRRALIGLLLSLTACVPPPARSSPQEPELKPRAAARLSPGAIAAFRGLVESSYAARWLEARLPAIRSPETSESKDSGAALKELEAQLRELAALEGKARRVLAEQLGEPPESPSSDLLAAFQKAVEVNGRYALIAVPREDGIASVMLLRLMAGAPLPSRVEGSAIKAHLYDEVTVQDFESFAASREARPLAGVKARVYGNRVYVDGPAVMELARETFFARLDYYAGVAERASQVDGFVALDGKPTELLIATKDALRWRAMAPLLEATKDKMAIERELAFLRDYATEQADRVSIFEASRIAAERSLGHPLVSAEDRRQASLQGFQSWILAAEPRGALATVLGLAAQQSASREALSDQHWAALQLAVSLEDKLAGPAEAPKHERWRRLSQLEPAALQALLRGIKKAP